MGYCSISALDFIRSAYYLRTARIWRDGQCVAVLKGHDKAIWGVGIVDDMYLTGTLIIYLFSALFFWAHNFSDNNLFVWFSPDLASADKSIRIWNESGQCIGTAMGKALSNELKAVLLLLIHHAGHEDCARSISNSDSNIYSCGNDGYVLSDFFWALHLYYDVFNLVLKRLTWALFVLLFSTLACL